MSEFPSRLTRISSVLALSLAAVACSGGSEQTIETNTPVAAAAQATDQDSIHKSPIRKEITYFKNGDRLIQFHGNFYDETNNSNGLYPHNIYQTCINHALYSETLAEYGNGMSLADPIIDYPPCLNDNKLTPSDFPE